MTNFNSDFNSPLSLQPGVQPSGNQDSEVNLRKENIVGSKDGRSYTVLIKHKTSWRVSRGALAAIPSLIGLVASGGFILKSEKFKRFWSAVKTGNEVVSREARANKISKETLIKADPLKIEGTLKKFEAYVKSLPTPTSKQTFDELHNEFNQFLMDKSLHSHPDFPVTMHLMSEKLVQFLIKKGNYSEAMQIRMTTTNHIPPSQTFNDLFKTESLKSGSTRRTSSLDSTLLKNHSLMVQERTVTGKSYFHVEGKLNIFSRKNMLRTVSLIKKNPDAFMQSLPPNFCTKLVLEKNDDCYQAKNSDGTFKEYGLSLGKVRSIHFEGVGSVYIGKSRDVMCHYNRIQVDLDPKLSKEEAAEKLHIILSSLGLGACSSTSRPMDQDRIKYLMVLRTYHPAAAFIAERDESTFNCSIDDLRVKLLKTLREYYINTCGTEWFNKNGENIVDLIVQGMENKFNNIQSLMYQQEVYPNYHVWAVTGFAKKVKRAGGIGLMSGVEGRDFKASCNSVVKMLKNGALSSQDRFQSGQMIKGASSVEDLAIGGGDSVYTRLINKKLINSPISNFPLSGQIQILYPLEMVERSCHGYIKDEYGSKYEIDYANRLDIRKLAGKIKKGKDEGNYDNEVCIRNRIPQQYIIGLQVSSTHRKEALIEILKKEGMIDKGNVKIDYEEDGKQKTKLIPIDEFIHVGNKFSADSWE